MKGHSETVFDRLAAIETDEHVLWPLHIGSVNRYGVVTIKAINYNVHRLALERRTSKQPPTVYACHRPNFGCPRHCLNYRHLYWGDKRSNMADMVIEGNSLRGERAARHKLKAAQVIEIRRRRAAGEPYKALGKEYGVSPHTIASIISGQNWGWLR